ncbi:MAG TPA: peptide chain release factor N(5)-glutamine methyltransferase [Stellaceae bacterium]|nr:peptide chain release factor N(5)-glutamine methyltransferase [Stellaceae bacterium]
MTATIGSAVADAAARLAAHGIESPRRDARLLVALASGLDDAVVLGYPERPLVPPASRQLALFLERRLKGEPISRLAGRREFWSLDFALSPDTLDPRPDSETIVEAALDRIADRNARLSILDLGTGTGCLLLALLSELPCAWGIGVDIVPGAALLARRNAAAIGLEPRAFFAVGDWSEAVSGRFDVVVANPPYIASGAIAQLAPEVAQFDPRTALDGGADGLQAYRAIAPDLAKRLAPAGFACIEVGAGQADQAAAIFVRAGLDPVGRRSDMAGLERCLILARTKKTVGISSLLV